jgi:hypothetical protein
MNQCPRCLKMVDNNVHTCTPTELVLNLELHIELQDKRIDKLMIELNIARYRNVSGERAISNDPNTHAQGCPCPMCMNSAYYIGQKL